MKVQGGLRPVLFAIGAGAIGAFGQAPYDQPLALFAGIVAVLWLVGQLQSPKQAAGIGWAFGFGYFLHALQWIVSPFMVDAARHGWMAPFALILLAGGLALFWGGAFWAAKYLSRQNLWPLVLCWSAAELVRAYVFTGFPWAMPAQALVNVLAGQALAWIGPYVLNAVIFAAAVLAVQSLMHGRSWSLPRLLREASIGVAMVLMVLPVSLATASLSDHTIRLVQPNAAQRDKWDADKIQVFFDRQLRFSAAPPALGDPPPDLVLWSETAIPWLLDRAEPALVEIMQASSQIPVALGVQRRDGMRFYNSMVVLGQDGAVVQTYDKHHLVPFGEYMPFGDLLARFGIYGLASQEGNGYSSGPGPTLLDFGALGKALPLICYEAVFAQDVNAAPERPDFLIQITNDAWFGKAAGPRQHLAQARMRAIEQGLPLARSANTGISAMIDPRGRILAALPLNEAGFVDTTLPLPLPPTVYSRTGDLPFAVVLFVGLFGWGLRSRRV